MIDIKDAVLRFYKRHLNKLSAILLFLIFLFVICLMVSILRPIMLPVEIALNAGHTTIVGDIYDGVVLDLEFSCPEDSLSGISFLVATYQQTIVGGSLVVSLVDSNGQHIFVKKIDSSDIVDNSTIELTFPEQTSSKGITYKLEFITENVSAEMPITFWANNHSIDNSRTRINGEEFAGTIIFSIKVIAETYPWTFDLLLLVSISFIFFVMAIGHSSLDIYNEDSENSQRRNMDE